MAIKIIKEGQVKFPATCGRCGCEFTYELEDVNAAGFVTCPCCGELIFHKRSDTVHYPFGSIPCGEGTNILSKNFCQECDFYKKYLAGGQVYVGDSPCQWCQHYPCRVTYTNEASSQGELKNQVPGGTTDTFLGKIK